MTPCDLNYFGKGFIQIQSHGELRLQHMILWGGVGHKLSVHNNSHFTDRKLGDDRMSIVLCPKC